MISIISAYTNVNAVSTLGALMSPNDVNKSLFILANQGGTLINIHNFQNLLILFENEAL